MLKEEKHFKQVVILKSITNQRDVSRLSEQQYTLKVGANIEWTLKAI